MVQNRDNIAFEIILTLLGGETHLRSMAKNINMPHSTVSRVLELLAKENVLDFRTEGRNKVFFIKKNLQAKSYVFNAERYKLIKVLRKYPELGIIIEDVLKDCRENMIVLFGSFAKGIAKKDSDIDIYICTQKRDVKDRIEDIHSKISVKTGSFDRESPLIKEIIKNHVILKGVEQFYEKERFFG